MNAEEARKLLDNGHRILLFKDGLGQYTALAVPEEGSVDAHLADWVAEDTSPLPGESTVELCDRMVFEGANRFAGCGFSIAEALHSLTEKVLFRRLPEKKTALTQLDAEKHLDTLRVGEVITCGPVRITRIASPFPEGKRFLVSHDGRTERVGVEYGDTLYTLTEAAAAYRLAVARKETPYE